MPAINLAKLNKEAARLADLFGEPAAFIRELREMLESYVNRTLRTRDAVAAASTLPTYRTPGVILRRIESELSPLAKENADQALELADQLWDEGYLETHLLAAFLLGHISPKEERLLARLTVWTQKVRDPNVRTSLLTHSLARLRKETPEDFLALVTEWLYPHREQFWSNGLQALLPLIKNPTFENLPPIFNLIEPVIEEAPTLLQKDIQNIILALYQDAPTETSYFLKSLVKKSENPKTKILLRRILPSLPTPFQESLQKELKSR
ncbi:MAG: DNA alkylation repair protein [Chloroflexi bacterium]|nr:DNA alkylation repair protein [Chloroflexota bacterium]